MITSPSLNFAERSFFFGLIAVGFLQEGLKAETSAYRTEGGSCEAALSVPSAIEPGRIQVRSGAELDVDLEAALGSLYQDDSAHEKPSCFSLFRPFFGVCFSCCSLFGECFYQAYTYGSSCISSSCCFTRNNDEEVYSTSYKKRYALAFVVTTVLIAQWYASFTLVNVADQVSRGCGDVKDVCAGAQASVDKVFATIENGSPTVKDFFKNVGEIVAKLPQIQVLLQRVLNAYYSAAGQGQELFEQHLKKIISGFSYLLEYASPEQVSQLIERIVNNIASEVEEAVKKVMTEKFENISLPAITPPPLPNQGPVFF